MALTVGHQTLRERAPETETSLRILFVLPGLHRYHRGAEVAFIALATELAQSGEDVTLMGSGAPQPKTPYRFIRIASIPRERFETFPRVPTLRNETAYEEATFAASLWCRLRPRDFDVTVTCSYPFTNWVLRAKKSGGKRPAHVFVTQNGDWPAYSQDAEYSRFGCDGLVCTNPEYFERNCLTWRSTLIPNGVDLSRFRPGPPERERFSLPPDRPVVLMVSALIPSKRVEDGIAAVAALPDAHLVVAGDGPLRDTIDALAASLLPGRYTRLAIPAEAMPALYRSVDTFLHLSLDESFGNVFLEALATGPPLVAHDNARIRWVVGEAAHLVDTTDQSALSAALEANRHSTPTSLERRVARAETFAWSAIAAKYRTFFAEIIERRLNSPSADIVAL